MPLCCSAPAALCALLYADGKLDVDAPFTEYISEHVLAKENCKVTVRDLAAHSGGFDNSKPYKTADSKAYFEGLFAKRPVRARGEKFEYACSNNDCMRLVNGATDVKWVGSPKTIRDRLDMMARTGRPIHVSEVTIAAPGEDQRSREIQAILVRNIYRAWFSHPSTMGITWWNTVDGAGVAGEPLVSGLFTRDMKKKPAYLALDELINREWRTNIDVPAKDGKVAFRGFRGRYRLTWTDADGKTVSRLVELQ